VRVLFWLGGRKHEFIDRQEEVPPGATLHEFADAESAETLVRSVSLDILGGDPLEDVLEGDRLSLGVPTTPEELSREIERRLRTGELRVLSYSPDLGGGGSAPAPETPPEPGPAAPEPERRDPIQLKVRFQICGGEPNGLGISGAEYILLRNGVEIARGSTDGNGEVPIEYLPGEGHVLRLFNTDYPIHLHAGLQPLTSLEGLQKRLDVLGYMTGYLLSPIENDTPDDGDDGPRTQQSVMNFQLDHNLLLDGIVGNQTRNALQSAVGG